MSYVNTEGERIYKGEQGDVPAGGNREESRSVWGGYTSTETGAQIPKAYGYQGYDVSLGIPKGYADRRSWLYKDTADLRAKQKAQLDELRAYATGTKSQARDQAARSLQQQQGAGQALAASAQRGGRSAGATRSATYAGDQASRTVGAQSRVAQQLERQRAAKAYQGASQRALASQMELEKIGRAYGQMGVQDKDRYMRFKREMDSLYGKKKALAYGDKLTEAGELGQYISAGLGATSGLLGGLASMAG